MTVCPSMVSCKVLILSLKYQRLTTAEKSGELDRLRPNWPYISVDVLLHFHAVNRKVILCH